MFGETDVTGSFGASAASAQARRREAIQEWLLSKLSEALAADPSEIDVREPLSTYGLGSITAVTMTGDLESWLRIELSPTLFWEYPTIEGLTVYLDERVETGEGNRA